MKKNSNLRSPAARAIEQVVEKGQSLSNVLPPLQQKVSEKDKALLQELCFGVLRTLSQLEWLIGKLMARPMTGKQRTVHFPDHGRPVSATLYANSPHAALAETVEGAVAIKRPQLKGAYQWRITPVSASAGRAAGRIRPAREPLSPSLNGCLNVCSRPGRNNGRDIVSANNLRPPMWLRVNRNHHSRDEWLALLEDAGLQGFHSPGLSGCRPSCDPSPGPCVTGI